MVTLLFYVHVGILWVRKFFLSNVIVYLDFQEKYSDDTSYHSSQDDDYVCDSQEDYSDSGDSYHSSFIDDRKLDNNAFYYDDQGNIRYFYRQKRNRN